MPDSIRHPGLSPGTMKNEFYVYILASKKNGTIYIGVTSDLIKRVWEHKNKVVKGFTDKYDVNKLVYFEKHYSVESAIEREKKLKNWKRKWKMDLIEKDNYMWKDLYSDILPGS
jgi:putative endonuclease